MPKQHSAYSAPAIDRMLDLAEYLAEQTRPVGVSELARALRFPVNSVFRIMKRLVERGYAECDEATSGYSLSGGFFALGMKLSVRFDLRLKARDILVWLSRTCAETAQLQAPDGDAMRVIDAVSTQTDFFLQLVPGLRVPAHTSAFGKCCLAFATPDERDLFLTAPLARLTKHTITARTALERELRTVARTGIAYDREEHTPGIFCIGAPVFNAAGKAVAGIGITGITGKINAAPAHHEHHVREAAARLSAAIGYDGSFFTRHDAARTAKPSTHRAK